jgi:hypothetical protein
MRSRYLLMFAGCAAGCANPGHAEPPRPPAGNSEVSSSCTNKRLASFDEVTIPSTFDVEMLLDDARQWYPAPSIRILLHHATRIELENLADFEEGLPTASGARAVLTLAFVGERIVPGSGGYFRSTYFARITRVCEPVPASGHSRPG